MSRIITMSQFGTMGRAANQFLQYAFLKTWAAKYSMDLEIPPWIGNTLFGTVDTPIGRTLPPYHETPGNSLLQPTLPNENDIDNRDYRGYGQYHTSFYGGYELYLSGLFRPTLDTESRLVDARKRLLHDCDITIGLHVRRGDYGRRIFPLTPISWYVNWLETHLPRLTGYKLFVASEDPTVASELTGYHVETAESLGVQYTSEQYAHYNYLREDLKSGNPGDIDWYPDFYLLSQCDIIVGGASTFSFVAAMLNPFLQEYWRATLADRQFVLTDPWDAYPFIREHVRDYSHIPGITASPDNPYWK